MACERCGDVVAMDGCEMTACFRAPNGAPLWFHVKLLAATDKLFLHPVKFCDTCFVSFLEAFGEVAEAKRLLRGTSPTERA